MKLMAHHVAAVSLWALVFGTSQVWAGPPNPTGSDGNGNTAGGAVALQFVITPGDCGTVAGCNNTAFGDVALQANMTGDNNTAIGFATLFSNNGSDNSATGANALGGNTTGGFNTANGSNALGSNTVGNQNTAIGVSALAGNTSGNLNTAVGSLALSLNASGLENTAVGAKALKKSTGTKNIGIGYQAGVTLTTGNNNIYIGNQGAGNESQTIRIGTAQMQTFIAGIAVAPVSGATVEIDTSTGQLGVGGASSIRYKRDIAPMAARSEKVLELHPVTFAYRDDAQGVEHYGLLAEEVAEVYPQLVTRSASGEIQTIRYQEMVPMLLNELQRQQRELHRQETALAELATLRKELTELRDLVKSPR